MRHFLAAAILLICAPASAQKSELIIAGIGANSCAVVLKNYREGPKPMGYLIMTWALGFWSSQNAMLLQAGTPMLKNLAVNDEAQIKTFMDECSRRPSEDFGLIVRDQFLKLPTFRDPNVKN
jgi:hypothetical protein